MEFTGYAMPISYALMDRQRFLIPLARGEIVAPKHQSDGLPGFGIGHSSLVMSRKVQISCPVNGFIRFVESPRLLQEPRVGEHSFSQEQGCPGSYVRPRVAPGEGGATRRSG